MCLFALSAVIAMSACQDATAPDEVVAANTPALRTAQSASDDELSALSDAMEDMTDWSLVALPDAKGKTKIVSILAGLKGNLKGKKLAACQQAVTDARSWFASLSDVEQTEVGQVGVTLDVIQAALDKAAQ
jgi:hypothetical protein